MATGWPMKTTYANGDVYSAGDVNDITGTINLLTSSTLSSSAGKNVVINGGMDIWQRGTSFAASGSGAIYTADRLKFTRADYQTGATVSRQTTSDTTNLASIQYAARVQRNSGDTGVKGIFVYQPIETVNSIPFAGKTVTLSFYARRGANYSSASNALSASLYSGTGVDQDPLITYSGTAYPIAGTATLTTTWQRFSYTGTVAANATELGPVFNYTPVGTAGANDYFEITGVQLELGSTATTFSRAQGTIQGELAACQRYYYRRTTTSQSYGEWSFGMCTSTTVFRGLVKFPTVMRIVPTAVEYSGTIRVTDNASYSAAVTAITITAAESTEDNARVNATTGGSLTTNQPAFLGSNNDTAAYLGFSAEL
jgi:hypothetical protein